MGIEKLAEIENLLSEYTYNKIAYDPLGEMADLIRAIGKVLWKR